MRKKAKKREERVRVRGETGKIEIREKKGEERG